jgi:glycosyltransferase involved in cell wall biosynthesis
MKIKYFPYQPHSLAFGGFDLQMLNAFKSVKELGVDVSKIDLWCKDKDYDIIHLWGIGPHNYNVIKWAKKSQKLLVATVLVPYFDTIRSIISYYRYSLSLPHKELVYYYNQVDKIVVVNDIQRDVLIRYYKISKSKITVIPNIIEDNFFQKPLLNFCYKYNISNYVLCTGNICSRKNQYNLALACLKLNLKLVIIGDVLSGEESYSYKLLNLIANNNNIIWIKGLPNGSDELAAAYYYCSVFALVSRDETQPISMLEATAYARPIVTLDKAYAKQKFYSNTYFSKSDKQVDIINALSLAYNSNGTCINQSVQECQSVNVGKSYKNLYESLHKLI